jgi:hypothetical protein
VLLQVPEEADDTKHNALRDYGSQLFSLSEAVRDDGSIDWAGVDQQLGIDLELECDEHVVCKNIVRTPTDQYRECDTDYRYTRNLFSGVLVEEFHRANEYGEPLTSDFSYQFCADCGGKLTDTTIPADQADDDAAARLGGTE